MDSRKTLFYFVRHGKSAGNDAGVMSGQTDHPLIDEGMREAYEVRDKVPEDYETVYSSDLVRCRQTTEIVNTKQLPVSYDARLRERDFGSLAGKKWEEVGEVMRGFDKTQQYDYRPYGGESAADVEARVRAFIADAKAASDGKPVLVVTSAGVIRLLHHLFNEKIELKIPNASVHEFLL